MKLHAETDSPSREDDLVESLTMGGWGMVDEFVSSRLAEEMVREIRQMDEENRFQPAAIGRGVEKQLESNIRGDRIAWLDMNNALPAQRRYLKMLEKLRQEINRRLYLGLFDLETHVAIYNPGSCYQKHMDNFQGDNRRVLTMVLYLNNHWKAADKGEIRLYFDDSDESDYIDIPPKAGRLVSFISNRFPHEVLRTQRERLSITGWFRQREG